MFKYCLIFVLFVGLAPAKADVLVLVHGYLGNAFSWDSPGVLRALQNDGYDFAGVYGYSSDGIVLQSQLDVQAEFPVAERLFYTLNLPSLSPLVIQADWLSAYLQHISQLHPGHEIVLVGHSAGGLVARLALIRHQLSRVKWLITLATPHQGTSRANQALQATNNGGWFGGIKSWLVRRQTGNSLYHTLKVSRGALLDLAPPRPGNLLFWLNQQPHPAIRYTSVIRVGTYRSPGDPVVPPFSQDLCLLPSVASSAERYVSQNGHFLVSDDGYLLLKLLKGEIAGASCSSAIKRP